METVNKFLELLNGMTLKTVKKENCESIHEVWNGLLGIDTMLKSENERHMAALSLNDMAKYCTDNKVSDYFSVTIFPLILKLHRLDEMSENHYISSEKLMPVLHRIRISDVVDDVLQEKTCQNPGYVRADETLKYIVSNFDSDTPITDLVFGNGKTEAESDIEALFWNCVCEYIVKHYSVHDKFCVPYISE